MPATVIRLVLVCLSLSVLNGCATSGVVTALSWSATGVSLITTGKSLTDHVISAAMAQDCAMLRTLQGHDACRALPAHGTSAALADSKVAAQALRAESADARLIALAQDVAAPRARAATSVPAPRPPSPSLPTVATRAPELATKPVPGMPDNLPLRFSVIGSFAERANARTVAAGITDYDAQVVAANTRQGLRYRVLLNRGTHALPSARALVAKGFVGAWSVTLCGASLNPPPCEQPELVAAAGN
jgi:hypothetical protein